MDDTRKRDLLFFFPAFIAWLLAFLIPSFRNLQAPLITLKTPTDIAGTTLFTAGLLIRVTAQATLKRNYSGTLRIREGHTLITHGIYSHIRHPVHTGALLSATATPIYTNSPPGTLTALTGTPLLNHRTGNEGNTHPTIRPPIHRIHEDDTPTHPPHPLNPRPPPQTNTKPNNSKTNQKTPPNTRKNPPPTPQTNQQPFSSTRDTKETPKTPPNNKTTPNNTHPA